MELLSCGQLYQYIIRSRNIQVVFRIFSKFSACRSGLRVSIRGEGTRFEQPFGNLSQTADLPSAVILCLVSLLICRTGGRCFGGRGTRGRSLSSGRISDSPSVCMRGSRGTIRGAGIPCVHGKLYFPAIALSPIQQVQNGSVNAEQNHRADHCGSEAPFSG